MSDIRNEIRDIIYDYDEEQITIATIGSHSALNILRGAQEEGFRTLVIGTEDRVEMYQRFGVADIRYTLKNVRELLDPQVQEELRELNVVLVPHGSFVAYLGTESIKNALKIPMFGNRYLLPYESDRKLSEEWLKHAGLNLPKTFESLDDVDRPVIVKFDGAGGGRGYFMLSEQEISKIKNENYLLEKISKAAGMKIKELPNLFIQEYVFGVPAYLHYFYSPLKEETEFMGADRRYESGVDNLGRIPAAKQLEINPSPTYTVVGNIPIVLRESLIPEVLRMGDNVSKRAYELAEPGIVGPYCLETMITEDLRIIAFEISARIVAGTSVWIPTNPYAYIYYKEPMYAGKRIAREIKNAIQDGMLGEILT